MADKENNPDWLFLKAHHEFVKPGSGVSVPNEFIKRAWEIYGSVEFQQFYMPAVLMFGVWEEEWKKGHPGFVTDNDRWATQFDDLDGNPTNFEHVIDLIEEEEPGLRESVNMAKQQTQDELALRMLLAYSKSHVEPSPFLASYILIRNLI